MFDKTLLSEDKDVPDRIEHGCDVLVDEDGNVDQYYNYFDYHFSGVGFRLRARAYIEWMDHVTLTGYVDGESKQLIKKEAFESEQGKAIIRYLQRRYREVRLSGPGSYVFPLCHDR